MRWAGLCAFLLAGLAAAQSAAPAQWNLNVGVEAAAADLAGVPAALQPLTRYLDLGPAESRQALLSALRGHIHQLSTEPEILPLNVVPGTTLLRLNIEDFGWPSEVWERLADSDPFHHARLSVQEVYETRTETVNDLWPGGPDSTGQVFAKGHPYTWERKVRVKVNEKQVSGALAPWLPAEATSTLAKLTGSRAPIVRGDWFLRQTAAQTDRVPGYYDFVGIKDRAGFELLIGHSAELAKAAKEVELLEAVADSRVAQQTRRVALKSTVRRMRYYQSFDNKLAIDKRNPLRVLNGEFEHDAEESFGPSPNGFWFWFLGDAAGKRQDAAPDFIGPDPTSQSNNGRIEVCIGCNRCHYQSARGGIAGIQNIEPWARKLFRNSGPFRLQSPSYEKLRELRQKYLRDLQGPIDDDRRTHARAVLQATGLTPEKWGESMANAFAAYEERAVDLSRAARETGLTKERLVGKLGAYLRLKPDTVLAGLLDGERIGIRQYEEAWPLLMEAVK